jgi:preprotein translocase subunit SecA
MGGIVLFEGNIAEMQTGEGKTLLALLPVFLRALDGEGAHVVTVNDYLAERDFAIGRQVYSFLGLSAGLILDCTGRPERKKSYACDVTYLSANQLGFDYLRDNLVYSEEDTVQRTLHYCVIDEVDSLIIDELVSPLVVSEPSETVDREKERDLQRSRDLVKALKKGFHYFLAEKTKEVTFSPEGLRFCQLALGSGDLFSPSGSWMSMLIPALRAKEICRRNRDYVLEGGEISIVDEFTGRILSGRRWSDGLHQALEVKEGLKPTAEGRTLASISYGDLFSLYRELSGMTGTVGADGTEIKGVYGMSTIKVPANRKTKREDLPDLIFRNQREKWRAVSETCYREHVFGRRPVLVGTTTVEKSELLSSILREIGVPHQLLNAKVGGARIEPEIVSRAGVLGSITIATNMAGRGTDILLGGSPDYLFHSRLRRTAAASPQRCGRPWARRSP